MRTEEPLGPGRRAATRYAPENRILRALPRAVLAELAPHLERVELKRRQLLMEPNVPVTHGYFIESGAASLVSRHNKINPIELSFLGRNSFVGEAIVLGTLRSPFRCRVHIPGFALRIGAPRMVSLMQDIEPLRRVLLCHLQAILVQHAQLNVCNASHTVEQRLSRWLLMANDVLDEGEVPATHGLIARMLGVRRASITLAMGGLARRGALASTRGRISILDSGILTASACECHGIIRTEYRRCLGLGEGPDDP